MVTTNPNIRENAYLYPDDSGESLSWVRMTPAEQKFARLVEVELAAGRIPTPTSLNVLLGRGRDNMLHGNQSKIRRSIFLGAGLVKDVSRDRWVRPSAPAR